MRFDQKPWIVAIVITVTLIMGLLFMQIRIMGWPSSVNATEEGQPWFKRIAENGAVCGW